MGKLPATRFGRCRFEPYKGFTCIIIHPERNLCGAVTQVVAALCRLHSQRGFGDCPSSLGSVLLTWRCALLTRLHPHGVVGATVIGIHPAPGTAWRFVWGAVTRRMRCSQQFPSPGHSGTTAPRFACVLPAHRSGLLSIYVWLNLMHGSLRHLLEWVANS